MEFKIDGRFVISQLLKAIVGYAVGVALVLLILKNNDPYGFIGASFAAGIVIYFAFYYPRSIVVEDGLLIFVKDNSRDKISLHISDVSGVSTNKKFYNTLTIATYSGDEYTLHPKDLDGLVNLLSRDK